MKIVIAGDHAVVGTGLFVVLSLQENVEVIITAADGAEAYQKVMEHKPDILTTDLSMPPGGSGLVATSKISESFPETKILILTIYGDGEYLSHALKNGAKKYILKNSPDEQLILAVRTVYKSETYIDMKLTISLINEFVGISNQGGKVINGPFRALSKRGSEVLPLIAEEYGNKEIAGKSFISVRTVEVYRTHIITRLNLKSKPESAEYALKKKLLDLQIC